MWSSNTANSTQVREHTKGRPVFEVGCEVAGPLGARPETVGGDDLPLVAREPLVPVDPEEQGDHADQRAQVDDQPGAAVTELRSALGRSWRRRVQVRRHPAPTLLGQQVGDDERGDHAEQGEQEERDVDEIDASGR